MQAPPAAEYVPAGHCAQLFLSAVEVSPALQSLQTPPAVSLYLPAGQDVQAPPAAEFLYLPAGQEVLQELLPAEPGGESGLELGQGGQEAVPPFEYVPAGQAVHVDLPTAGVCVPAGQVWQEVDASHSLIVPAGQRVHEAAPASAENSPAPQGLQAVMSPRPALSE